jgi:hypothetical protein
LGKVLQSWPLSIRFLVNGYVKKCLKRAQAKLANYFLRDRKIEPTYLAQTQMKTLEVRGPLATGRCLKSEAVCLEGPATPDGYCRAAVHPRLVPKILTDRDDHMNAVIAHVCCAAKTVHDFPNREREAELLKLPARRPGRSRDAA